MDKPKTIIKQCPTHGQTEFKLEKRGFYRCKKCNTMHVSDQRRRNKEKLISLHGGECVVCGYNKCIRALQFHHIDPAKKEFTISSQGRNNFENMRQESEKCALVCSNCHCEIEAGITTLPPLVQWLKHLIDN